MCSETSVTFYICRLPKYFSFCVSKSLEELWSTSCFRYSISHAKKRRKYWVLFHACLVLNLAWLWGAELRQEPLELWKCSTQSGQMLKFTFRKVFVTADTHCSDGVFLSSFCADELLDGNQTATPLCMSCAAGSHFDPWFFQKVNVQLGCILGCICILLWNRTCNKIIFIDKISQAIKTSCLLQQPCYKNKPCETSSPWYSALSQVLNGSYQTIGRHCSLQVLILTESFQSTDQQMEALTCERDRRTALAFLSWVQNKCCSHHTVGQMTSTLQLNTAHMVPFFWDTTACRRTEERYSTFIPRGTGNSKRPGLEGSPSKVALLCGRGPTSRHPVLHVSPHHSTIASQYSLLYV